jgi:hypothetical protein
MGGGANGGRDEEESCIVGGVSIETPSSPASSHSNSPLTGAQEGFALEATDTTQRMECQDVRGFADAVVAAHDATVALPSRLNLVAPSATACDWLARWAEDAEQVRRTIMIRRRSDGMKLMAVVTLSSYGAGIETSLAVESATAPWRRAGTVRSGVHPKATIDEPLPSGGPGDHDC